MTKYKNKASDGPVEQPHDGSPNAAIHDEFLGSFYGCVIVPVAPELFISFGIEAWSLTRPGHCTQTNCISSGRDEDEDLQNYSET